MTKPTINFSGYDWILQEHWGQIHEKKSYCWYDPSAVETKDNQLILKTHYNPKYFGHLELISPIGIGLVSTNEKFKHGKFEIAALLPNNPWSWPGFWFYAALDNLSWPPEGDCFEGYSNKNGSYFKWRWLNPLGFWNVQTNVHYKDEDGAHKMLGGKTHFFTFKNPYKHFIKYKFEWFPDVINYYYNDKKVRSIKDKFILDQFNQYEMVVIINNHVKREAFVNAQNHTPSEMVIDYFKYTPYEN